MRLTPPPPPPIKARYTTINLALYCTRFVITECRAQNARCGTRVRYGFDFPLPRGESARSYLEGWRQVSDRSRPWRAKPPNQCGYCVLVVITVEPYFGTHRRTRLKACTGSMLIWVVRRSCETRDLNRYVLIDVPTRAKRSYSFPITFTKTVFSKCRVGIRINYFLTSIFVNERNLRKEEVLVYYSVYFLFLYLYTNYCHYKRLIMWFNSKLCFVVPC